MSDAIEAARVDAPARERADAARDGRATLLAHPRLEALIATVKSDATIAIAYPCDALAIDAAVQIAARGLARPLLVGPPSRIRHAADAAQLTIDHFEIVSTEDDPRSAATRAAMLARDDAAAALMKGALHTDELMAAVVSKDAGLRTASRISHTFVFDLPRYHKLLAVTDCVVNIAPTLADKRDILANAIELLHRLGIARPKVAIVAAVETVNPAMPATLDAAALVQMAVRGQIRGALVDGPLGFDNAISAESARIKRLTSVVAGDPDLLLVPDLQAGNMLYKSFSYLGGGECAGLVLGARVPVVLTSRADSLLARIASVALGVIHARAVAQQDHEAGGAP